MNLELQTDANGIHRIHDLSSNRYYCKDGTWLYGHNHAKKYERRQEANSAIEWIYLQREQMLKENL